MNLVTQRLLLRPFRQEDFDDVVGYATREEFWRHLPLPVQTPETVAAFIAARVAGGHPDADHNWHFAAELSDPSSSHQGRVIGAFRIGIRDGAHRQGDLGWSLHPELWGRGLAFEGASALVGFGFTDLGLERIWATANAENERSWKVMERIGMRREGYLRRNRLVRGEWRDNVLYAILREEFEAARSMPAAAMAA